MNSTGKIVLALVGAAAAGAVLGLLLAPEKGSDLRKRISDATGDFTSQLSQMIANGKAQLENLKNSATNAGGEQAETSDRFDSVRERVS